MFPLRGIDSKGGQVGPTSSLPTHPEVTKILGDVSLRGREQRGTPVASLHGAVKVQGTLHRIDNARILLPSASKAVVDGNPVHFGVARA